VSFIQLHKLSQPQYFVFGPVPGNSAMQHHPTSKFIVFSQSAFYCSNCPLPRSTTTESVFIFNFSCKSPQIYKRETGFGLFEFSSSSNVPFVSSFRSNGSSNIPFVSSFRNSSISSRQRQYFALFKGLAVTSGKQASGFPIFQADIGQIGFVLKI
jgi:hypothetical protein